jgi:hypothetical protein
MTTPHSKQEASPTNNAFFHGIILDIRTAESGMRDALAAGKPGIVEHFLNKFAEAEAILQVHALAIQTEARKDLLIQVDPYINPEFRELFERIESELTTKSEGSKRE